MQIILINFKIGTIVFNIITTGKYLQTDYTIFPEKNNGTNEWRERERAAYCVIIYGNGLKCDFEKSNTNKQSTFR